MTWLGEQWHGKVFLGGWTPGSAGDRAVTAPATGAELARVGLAGPADVATAAEQAAAAQRDWAAHPYTERAAVFRRAGDLLTEHAAEIGDWIVNESGSVRGKAELEVHLTAQECYEAAAL
ncbi:MAG TPA: aldehyde dehydrogenase family protein, partial [Pseudonocardiaceae bacterium]